MPNADLSHEWSECWPCWQAEGSSKADLIVSFPDLRSRGSFVDSASAQRPPHGPPYLCSLTPLAPKARCPALCLPPIRPSGFGFNIPRTSCVCSTPPPTLGSCSRKARPSLDCSTCFTVAHCGISTPSMRTMSVLLTVLHPRSVLCFKEMECFPVVSMSGNAVGS